MYYSGQEIYEIAVRIEENGQEFYTLAADKIKEYNDTKALFLDLADKEVLHIGIFQKLFEKFEPEDFEFPSEDASSYIAHLAESHIFGKPEAGVQLAAQIKDPKHALETALKFELDSVAFYTEILKSAKSDSRKLVQQIIAEEEEHAADIRKFL
jgi:rubrerythrin